MSLRNRYIIYQTIDENRDNHQVSDIVLKYLKLLELTLKGVKCTPENFFGGYG